MHEDEADEPVIAWSPVPVSEADIVYGQSMLRDALPILQAHDEMIARIAQSFCLPRHLLTPHASPEILGGCVSS